MYATLNIQGSCNNLCDTNPDPAEEATRNAADIAWMQRTFSEAISRGSAAIMFIAQADPGFDKTDGSRGPLRDPKTLAEQRTFSGRTIDVPACFIAGKSDWGAYQNPGVFEKMQTTAVCTQWRGAHFVDGAGHWAQQEQPEEVVRLLLQFLRG